MDGDAVKGDGKGMMKLCERCGEIMETVRNAQRFCPRCAEIRRKMQNDEHNKRYRAKMKEQKVQERRCEKIQNGSAIEAVNQRAIREGVSYGTIQAREYQAKVKVRKPEGWKGKCCR